MQSINSILVGVDLTHADRLVASDLNEQTAEAVERAIWVARMFNAKLEFFAAIDLSAHTKHLIQEDKDHLHKNVTDEANAVMQTLIEQAKAQGVDSSSKVALGPPWREIILEVIKNNHDMVLVGTRPHGFTGRLFGGTVMNLFRQCPCPVYAVKVDDEPDVPEIVVASDMSEVSTDILNFIVNAAQVADMKIHLVHAIDTRLDERLKGLGINEQTLKKCSEDILEEVKNELNEQLAQTDFRTLSFGVQVHVLEGSPEVAIPEFIAENKVNLLAMGTLARSGLSGFFIGNTAERMLEKVDCSVLTFKPADFVSPVVPE
ncbi:universal stress protein [Gimesia maris]|nr:universal stress protein [Gimesia maris]EDL61907.1 Universal stress protein UspA [Gimesia maris DSM 8797]QDT80775.1 Universal stress protein E [Gimesia maris]QDU16491.1 Universal stress protein E [Gimesia maris]QEG18537.1 Universal stress protein E [Gimesia maris]|tara:strand:- start:30550 stop:31500 length:951 start_codon:yes stop_codon:yes gene_type:complete